MNIRIHLADGRMKMNEMKKKINNMLEGCENVQ